MTESIQQNSSSGLSGNALKLIAAITMFLDHLGLILFPQSLSLRIVGRIAMPIYAFLIAEGCRYTRSRLRYFLGIFLLGSGCQLVYYFFDGSMYFNILITFSLAILMIYALQELKGALARGKAASIFLAFLVFSAVVFAVFTLNRYFTIDYGFWGCMLPVFAAVFHRHGDWIGPMDGKLDDPRIHASVMMFVQLLTWKTMGGIQFFALMALPLLLCYNGTRGKGNLKYFFYLFYPLHLALLQGIAMVLALMA